MGLKPTELKAVTWTKIEQRDVFLFEPMREMTKEEIKKKIEEEQKHWNAPIELPKR